MAADEIVQSAENGLKMKIGGVPFYVYGAGIVIGFYLWKRHKDNQAAAVAADVTTSADGTPDALAYQSPNPSFGGPTPLYTQNQQNNPSDVSLLPGNDLQDWIRRGTDFLVQHGYNGTTADSALAGFASGQAVTGSQQRLVDLWISQPDGGAPPGGKPGPVGQGPGISYNVPNNITINPVSGWKVAAGQALHYQVIWKDAYGQPVTGSLMRWGNTNGSGFLVRETVSVKNGQADVNLPVHASGQFYYTTLPLDPKYSKAQSATVTYTVVPVHKPAPKPKPKPAPKPVKR